MPAGRADGTGSRHVIVNNLYSVCGESCGEFSESLHNRDAAAATL